MNEVYTIELAEEFEGAAGESVNIKDPAIRIQLFGVSQDLTNEYGFSSVSNHIELYAELLEFAAHWLRLHSGAVYEMLDTEICLSQVPPAKSLEA